MYIKKFFLKTTLFAKNGFNLLELLLTVLTIGLLFAIIVPKLINFRVDAQHGIVNQNCKELAASVQQWLQKMIRAQDDHSSSATFADYVATLANREPEDPFSPPVWLTGQWIATEDRPNNWNRNNLSYDLNDQLVPVIGRRIGSKRHAPPESVVEESIPGEKGIKNPFNKENIFRPVNDPISRKHPVPGAIAFASVLAKDGTLLYGFCFQGRDSTTFELNKATSFHNNQSLLSIQGIEHCGIFAKYR